MGLTVLTRRDCPEINRSTFRGQAEEGRDMERERERKRERGRERERAEEREEDVEREPWTCMLMASATFSPVVMVTRHCLPDSGHGCVCVCVWVCGCVCVLCFCMCRRVIFMCLTLSTHINLISLFLLVFFLLMI